MQRLLTIVTTLPLVMRYIIYAAIAMITSMAIVNLYTISLVSKFDFSEIRMVSNEIDRINNAEAETITRDDSQPTEKVNGASTYYQPITSPSPVQPPKDTTPDIGIPLPDPDPNIKP